MSHTRTMPEQGIDPTRVLNRIKRRLIPFLSLLYLIAFIDRANIGYLEHALQVDLGMTATVFGLATGVFTIGYAIFEVPSNMLMRRVGARKWMARILFSWGAIAMLMGFVQDSGQLIIGRALLGVAEAGFFPCIILYLTFWFPRRERAKVVAQFMVALPLASVVAGPLSGWILDNVAWLDMSGWRWVFIIEGAPAILLGFITLLVLVDGPKSATWLSTAESSWLVRTIEAENTSTAAHYIQAGFWRSLLGAKTLALSFIYFTKSTAVYVLAYFSPGIIAGLGATLTNTQVGWIIALPYFLAAIIMVLWARSSDRLRERRWHAAGPLFLAAGGLIGMAVVQGNIVLSVLMLIVVTVGTYAVYGPFWSLPSLIMTGPSAAIGIAAINSLATLGGFIGPVGMGVLKDATGGSPYPGLFIIAGLFLVAGIMVLASPFIRQAQVMERSDAANEIKA